MSKLSPNAKMIRCKDAAISYDQMVAAADRSALYEIHLPHGGASGIGEHDEIVGFVADGIFPADIRLVCIARAI